MDSRERTSLLFSHLALRVVGDADRVGGFLHVGVSNQWMRACVEPVAGTATVRPDKTDHHEDSVGKEREERRQIRQEEREEVRQEER